jgi:hypothetical protein
MTRSVAKRLHFRRSRRRDSNPRPPLYESAQREETERSEGSSEGINALQIRLF